jgi:hypothetical protein
VAGDAARSAYQFFTTFASQGHAGWSGTRSGAILLGKRFLWPGHGMRLKSQEEGDEIVQLLII